MLLVRYGMTARNLLRGQFIETLTKGGARIVVVTPAANEPYIKEELEPLGVTLVQMPPLRKRLRERLWDYITDALVFNHPGTTRTVTIKWLHEGIIHKHYMDFFVRGAASVLFLHKSRRLRRLLLHVGTRFCSHPELAELFDTYKPDLFVASYTFEPDVHYLQQAISRGIKSIDSVRSWDNLSSKTRMTTEPDVLVTWSPHMKEEAMRLHSVPEERIAVVGTPQFDTHFNYVPTTTREQFMESIGAQPDKRLLVYCPEPKWTFSDHDNLRLIHEIISEQDFPYDVHIHVRNYPKVERNFKGMEEEMGITSERGGTPVAAWDDGFDQSLEQAWHMADLMERADVVVQVSSTIALDAACHDTPCIGMSLDPTNPQVPWALQARRGYETTHYKLLVDIGALKLARSREELRELLIRYLDDPSHEREERSAAIDLIVWRRTGDAGKALATFVLGQLPQPPGAA
jgi:hypothetical protein